MTSNPTPDPHQKFTLAVLGGTGAEGSGLALRWAHAGHRVILGSRSPDKAAGRVSELNALLGREAITWQDNLGAARAADIVVLTVPHAAQRATVEEVRAALAGKILIDATVPLVPPKVNRVQLPEGGSAVAAIQALLGAGVRVVSAFQNVSAHHLKDLDHAIDCDVLVCGDDIPARQTVVGLVNDVGLRGVQAGPICNSAAAEALTSILISINMAYKVPGAGLRITGVAALENA
ncbi:MAG: NADPH-dependent F420 reductase [Burkholderiaceae bacterium]|nr:NADPH-dependent F420 reductase [Burkholderiaceae bacterium]